MSKKNKNLSYALIPTIEGVSVAFPVSKHILNTKKVVAKAKPYTLNLNTSRVVTSLAVIATLNIMSLGVLFPGADTTIAYFRDAEASRTNLLAAGSLGFDLNPGEITLPIAVGTPTIVSPRFMPDDETLPITYRVTTEVVGESNLLCSRLYASGTSSPFLYQGPLASLITEPATDVGHGHLDVTISDPSDLMNGMQCTVDVVYRGWHEDMPENTGYTDEERDRFTFVLGGIAESAPEEAPEPITEESTTPEIAPESSEEPTSPDTETETVDTETEPMPEPEPLPLPEPESSDVPLEEPETPLVETPIIEEEQTPPPQNPDNE